MCRAGLGSKRRSRVVVRVESGEWGREEIGGRDGDIFFGGFWGWNFVGVGFVAFFLLPFLWVGDGVG